MTEEIKTKLRSYYQSDVAQLSDMLGRDLNHWLARPTEKCPDA